MFACSYHCFKDTHTYSTSIECIIDTSSTTITTTTTGGGGGWGGWGGVGQCYNHHHYYLHARNHLTSASPSLIPPLLLTWATDGGPSTLLENGRVVPPRNARGRRPLPMTNRDAVDWAVQRDSYQFILRTCRSIRRVLRIQLW